VDGETIIREEKGFKINNIESTKKKNVIYINNYIFLGPSTTRNKECFDRLESARVREERVRSRAAEGVSMSMGVSMCAIMRTRVVAPERPPSCGSK